VTMIGVGAMIGTSIFVLLGVIIGEIGPAVMLVLALNAFATMFTAATYAELGSSFPEAGGGYLWAQKAMPHPAGFMSGWLSWFGHTIACSFYSLGFGFAMVALVGYFDFDILGLSDSVLVKLFAAAAILFFVGINYVGVGATGKTGTSVTLIQILIIAFFVTFAFIYALDTRGVEITDNFEPILPADKDLTDVLMVMGFTFLAFEGYEIIVQCGEEVKDPKRNIPRAVFISVAVAALLYAGVAFVALANFDMDWIGQQGPSGENAVFAVGRETIPFVGAPLMIFGGILSAMAALNATVFSSSRVSFAMGREGSLPRRFGRIHEKRRIPHNAIAITGAIMLFMAVFFDLDVVVASTSIMFLLLFALANIASIRLRRRLTEMDIGFKTPLFPLFPVLGATFTLGIAVYLWFFIPEAWYVAIVWIVVGLIASAAARPSEMPVSIASQRRVPRKPLTKEEVERYRVFLALENLGDLRLVESAGIFSRYFDGDLTVNKIIEVPRTMPLDAISKEYVDEQAEGLRKAVKVAPSTVTVHPVIAVSYDAAGSILDAIRHEAANLLVLGWKGTRRRGGTILGRNLDRVVKEAPCDVSIIKTRRLSKNIERILVVVGGYFETRKALLLALPLAKEYGAKITLLAVITDDSQVALTRGNSERLSKMCDRIGVENEVKFVHTKSFVNSVLEQAKVHDILVMGAGPPSTFERTMFGAVYDRIIRSVDVPVLVLRTARVQKGAGSSTAMNVPRASVGGLD